MPLYDRPPPHRITLKSVTSGTDEGGGVTLTYTTAQSAVPCSINTASSSERALFAQMGIVVTHTIAMLASVLTTVPQRGWKATTDDRAESFHVRGIRHGRAYGSIPSFVMLDCEQIL